MRCFGGAFFLGIALLPAMLALAPLAGISAVTKREPSPIVFAFFAMVGVAYTYCVMGAWVHFVFFAFIPSGESAAKIPLLLWSYSTATAIWNYMAQQDARSNPNSYASMSSFFNQIGVVSAIFYAWGCLPSHSAMGHHLVVGRADGDLLDLANLDCPCRANCTATVLPELAGSIPSTHAITYGFTQESLELALTSNDDGKNKGHPLGVPF